MSLEGLEAQLELHNKALQEHNKILEKIYQLLERAANEPKVI